MTTNNDPYRTASQLAAFFYLLWQKEKLSTCEVSADIFEIASAEKKVQDQNLTLK